MSEVFGGGLFSWGTLPGGQLGWVGPSGRYWDALGNPFEQAQPVAQPSQAQRFVAPVANQTPSTLPHQQQAQSFLQGIPDVNRTNVANFLRLPKSAQEFTLAAHEARGLDKGDVLEQFGRMLPKATGPKRGYVAPLGG